MAESPWVEGVPTTPGWYFLWVQWPGRPAMVERARIDEEGGPPRLVLDLGRPAEPDEFVIAPGRGTITHHWPFTPIDEIRSARGDADG
jgi:hypothetical protein